MTTLNAFITENQKDFPYATGELTRLLNDIGIAAKIVNREINKAGLADISGYFGTQNVQGEDQKKLDVFANDQFLAAMRHGGMVCAVASEENEKLFNYSSEFSQGGKYVLAMDPLDGSSNIEVNVPIGTIFSIYRRISPDGPGQEYDLLQPGNKQVAAGYVVYGSSTMLVYTTGNGVNGFTLDPSVGLFLMSHPNMRFPPSGNIYSINEGNYVYFPEGIKRFLKYCQVLDPATKRPYTSRYVGSLVSDFHRNLIRGGVFMYPGTYKNPNGKLRLLYECNPMAFLAEQAGGKASDGFNRILDIEPNHLHQRVPLIIGSKELVEKVEELMAKYSPQKDAVQKIETNYL